MGGKEGVGRTKDVVVASKASPTYWMDCIALVDRRRRGLRGGGWEGRGEGGEKSDKSEVDRSTRALETKRHSNLQFSSSTLDRTAKRAVSESVGLQSPGRERRDAREDRREGGERKGRKLSSPLNTTCFEHEQACQASFSTRIPIR